MVNHALIQDITFKPDGTPRLSQDELKKLCELGVTISDTETTGLNRHRNGLSEVACMKAVKEQGAYRLKLFHAFCLPLRPHYQDYVSACEIADSDGTPRPAYDRQLYEYEIAPQALAVTGTEILREQGADGPITGLKVLGERVEAQPFYKVYQAFLDFIGDPERDVYYNAPYDKTFLVEQLRDVEAHELAHDNLHLSGFDEVQHATRSEHAAVQKMLREHKVRVPQMDWEDANPLEQQEITEAVRKALDMPQWDNPAQWRCLFHGFLRANGIGESNRLDDAYRALVNPDFTEREEHSAVEDITMAAQVGVRLADHFDGRVPTMLELYADLVHRVDPQAEVKLSAPRSYDSSAPRGRRKVWGDVEVTFSQPPEKLGENAQKLWAFLEGFDEVKKRNNRVPQHIVRIDKRHHRVVINAERQNPLSIGFLKKWMFFDQLIHSPDDPSKSSAVIDTIVPFDSTGTRIDVKLKDGVGSGRNGGVVEDVHLASLRANLAFIEAHPDMAEDILYLIRSVRNFDRRIGMVLVRQPEPDGPLQVVLKGHVRDFGEVVLQVPKDAPLARADELFSCSLDFLLKLGVIPYVGGVDEQQDADIPAYQHRGELSAPVSSAVDVSHNRITIRLSAEVMHLLAVRQRVDIEEMARSGIHTALGEIAVQPETVDDGHGESHIIYRLEGDIKAFQDFTLYQSTQAGGKAQAKDDQIGEKTANIVRDASWLLYRLKQVPGTFDITLDGNMAVLQQKDGVDAEALGLLYRAHIPFKAYPDAIKVDIAQMMQDAFHWSQALSRRQDERNAERDTPVATQQHRPPAFLRDIQHLLLRGEVKALEMDDHRRCYLLDGTLNAAGEDRHYLVDTQQGEEVKAEHDSKGKLDVARSTIAGGHRTYFDWQGDRLQVQTSTLVDAVARHMLNGKVRAPHGSEQGGMVQVRYHADEGEQVVRAYEQAARLVYRLSKASGIERMPMRSVALMNDMVELHVEPLGILRDEVLLHDLSQAHAQLTQPQLEQMLRQIQQSLPQPRKSDYRRDDLLVLADRTLQLDDTLSAIDAQVRETMHYTSGGQANEHPNAVNYAERIRSDLGVLGLLIHELSSQVELDENKPHSVADIVRRQRMYRQLDQVHEVREKLANLGFAIDRLDEQLGVLRKSISGSNTPYGVRGGLRQALAQTMLYLVDAQALEVVQSHGGEDLAARMAPYEAKMLQLFNPVDRQDDGLKLQDLSVGFAQRAFEHLMQMPRYGAQVPEILPVVRYLLERGYPQWTEAQVDAVIGLYTRGVDEKGLEKSRRQLLAAGFDAKTPKKGLGVPHLLQQREMAEHWHAAEHAEAYQLPEDKQAELDERIRRAYKTRAGYYLKLLPAPLDEQAASQSEAERSAYESKARHCLQQAGLSADEIDDKIVKARGKFVKDAQKAHARGMVTREVDLAEGKLKDVLGVIDAPGAEARARELITQQLVGQHETTRRQLSSYFPEAYGELKQRKMLLNALGKVLEETHDLLMIKYHTVRDLAGVVSLLNQDPAQQRHVGDALATQINHIVNQLRHTPEVFGLQQDDVQCAKDSCTALGKRALQQADARLRQFGIVPEVDEAQQSLRFPFARLLAHLPELLAEDGVQLAGDAAKEATPAGIRDVDFGTVMHSVADQVRRARPYLAMRTEMEYVQGEGRMQTVFSAASASKGRDQSLIAQWMERFATSHAGLGCQLGHAGDQTQLNVPVERVQYASTLLCAVSALNQQRAVREVNLSPDGTQLQAVVQMPRGKQAREKLFGHIKLACAGLMLKPPAFDTAMRGNGGDSVSVPIAIAPELLESKVIPPREAKLQDVADAAHAYAMTLGVPGSERQKLMSQIRSFPERHPDGGAVRKILNDGGHQEAQTQVERLLSQERSSGRTR